MSAAQRVTLVGDGIENDANARVMNEAAAMFGAACRVRPAAPLAEMPDLPSPITADELAQLHARRIAFDNLPGARDVYGYRAGPDFALIVGNERRGLSHSFRAAATDAVQIPMLSRQINCLNVAAASAVGLYYLCAEPVRPSALRSNAAARRPTVLLLGAGEHIELGSSIRSAAAFGWERALVEDRDGVWFGVDRVRRSEGRAAARRGRNDIRLAYCTAATRYDADEAVIVTTRTLGPALRRVDLARGARQIVVIAAENRIDVEREDWTPIGRKITFAHLDLPVDDYRYHYRLLASIALAEIARQVGQRSERRPPARRGLEYDWALPIEAGSLEHAVSWAELIEY
jgi:hypothetical protein